MSETHYWPGADEIGWHCVEHKDGEKRSLWWNGKKWSDDQFAPWQRTTEQVREMGYLGVRREPEKLTPSDTAEILARSAEDNAAIAREAREELRMCRRSYEFERWAIKWGPVLCQMLGAE